MVVNTRTLTGGTPDEALDKAVQYAAVAGERDKTKMVCAILHNGHYDLGVLHTAQGVQVVFEVGEEWDNAIRLILNFIRAKLPKNGQARGPICPFWIERTNESEKKASVNPRGAGIRSSRTQNTTQEGGATRTRAGKTKEIPVCIVARGPRPHATTHAHSTPHIHEYMLLTPSNNF